MKIKLAILEKDASYLTRFVSVFSTKYADKMEIYSFSDKNAALTALEESRINVFIASDVFEIEAEQLPKRCSFAEDGTLLKELINYEGDALTELLEKNNGEISFGVGEGINQRIQIICKDSSVNEAGDRNTYDEIFTISVSANAFTLFWNTYGMPIMIGGGAATALTAFAAGVFVFRKKNKK